ncbi:MAG: radical SAM protein [Candidatus Polarisedimenticolaceae bacterium]|nr:radical SAM protein [Candidatus Polarisedimenticolaceae bacterium]
MQPMNDLFLIAINLTRRCNLACEHCYMDAEARLDGGEGELTTDEVKALLDEICSRSNETMVVLTGGEPLIRQDIETLVEHGSQLGLSMVIGTNGVLLDEARVKSLKAAGAMGVGISLDSLDPSHHDAFRGCNGSWEKTLNGMELCRLNDLPFQVHFSVTEKNAHEVQSMIDFTKASGAHVLNIFFLVCTGRGESMSDITPYRYEQVLQQLVEAQEQTQDLIIRARCAPHYKRVAYQHNSESTLTRAEGYEGGGCLAGLHYCRITPEGGVTACPYIPDEDGSIRKESFWQIWDNAPTFKQLRNPTLNGKCGQCEFQKLCGGCRARPLAMGGSLMDTDPWCSHTPSSVAMIEPLVVTANNQVTWSAEAEKRLERVPGFLRKMVRKRAEAHVAELGESTVTTEHMATLAARRFGDKFPGQRPGMPTMELPKQRHSSSGLAWTREAKEHLETIPSFLREGVFQVAEDVARSEGRLEVNMQLLKRLDEESSQERTLPWHAASEQCLEDFLSARPMQARIFIQPSMEAAAEREAKLRNAIIVLPEDVAKVIKTELAGVEWDSDALKRVESAPDFVRAGIKKAAEFNARREGLKKIDSDSLTRFRNKAMMRAVKRMKGFGMNELSFDGFAIAQKKVPRLQENSQAEKRFAEIQEYVESKQGEDGSGLGLLDQKLMDKMKAELKQ